jgi:hypothetical protein
MLEFSPEHILQTTLFHFIPLSGKIYYSPLPCQAKNEGFLKIFSLKKHQSIECGGWREKYKIWGKLLQDGFRCRLSNIIESCIKTKFENSKHEIRNCELGILNGM